MLDAVRHTLAPYVVACSVVVALCAGPGRASAEADPADMAVASSAEPAIEAREASEGSEGSDDDDAVDAVAPEAQAEAQVEAQAGDAAVRKAGRRQPARRAAPPVAAAPAREQFDLRPLTSSPVPGVESSGFGWREDPFHRRSKFHKGMDFRAPRGTSVFAAGTGVVVFAGRKGGYGNAIFIDHGDGVITRYGHLRKIHVATGAKVSGGARVGEVGSTGRATGPHLHFEVRLDGRAVNPQVAMSVASLQRTDVLAARAAASALAPEVQERSYDRHTRTAKAARPERRGRAKRSQVLW